MIRSKGEAGTGDVSNAVTPHAHDPRRDPPAPRRCAADELYVAAKELQAPLRPGQGGRRDRQAAGRPLHRRRHRHPGRRRDDDAARRRRRLRRLRHLQVRQPGRSAPRPSSRRPRSTTTPTSSPRSPAASARPWSASTSTRSRSRTGSPSAAGDRRRPSAHVTVARDANSGRSCSAPSRTACSCCAARSTSVWVRYIGANPSRTMSASRKSPTTSRAMRAWTTP